MTTTTEDQAAVRCRVTIQRVQTASYFTRLTPADMAEIGTDDMDAELTEGAPGDLHWEEVSEPNRAVTDVDQWPLDQLDADLTQIKADLRALAAMGRTADWGDVTVAQVYAQRASIRAEDEWRASLRPREAHGPAPDYNAIHAAAHVRATERLRGIA